MPSAEASPPKKQAVVLIHGIGEQRPMATLWKLVDLVWTDAPQEPGAPPRKVYSEPDEVSGVFELRRLSTNPDAAGRRTDFYEYYWAHLMADNSIGDVVGWLGALAARRKDEVPPQLVKAWRTLRVLGIAGMVLLAALALAALLGQIYGGESLVTGLVIMFAALFVLATAIDNLFVSPVLGDAARYLRPDPKNIQARQEIRERGLRLIEALSDSGKYDRIIVVGHSLGGLIAYELVCHLWGRRNRAMAAHDAAQEPLAEAEAAALALEAAPQDAARQRRWREAQRLLSRALAQPGTTGAVPWLISDLVTLGCPLAHADTLLARNRAEFEQFLARRELQLNPPMLEVFPDGGRRFTYCRRPGAADDSAASPRAPHNAAAFSAVRWSNLYFPMQGILRGDLVGGPVAALFGPGVTDMAVRPPREGGFAPHMHYFERQDGPHWGPQDWQDHRRALREAMALEERP